jgi:hypothetical protein
VSAAYALLVAAAVAGGLLAVVSTRRRPERRVRLLVEPYRNDRATPEALLGTFTAMHSLLTSAPRGARRGARTIALEVHLDRRAGGAPIVWFAIVAKRGLERHLEAALRATYPNVRLRELRSAVEAPPVFARLRRHTPLHRVRAPASRHDARTLGSSDALLRALAAAGAPASVQLLLAPTSRIVEHLLTAMRERKPEEVPEPAGALCWSEVRVFARDRDRARALAAAVRSGRGDSPRLAVARGVRAAGAEELTNPSLARSMLHLYRLDELTGLWQLPSPDFAALPCLRRALPLAPAPPGITRAWSGAGLLRDEHGGVTIAMEVRRQHTAVVGAVEQGKSSYLVASAREDLRRENCAVIVLDPKGDAADAVLSIVPDSRTCTLLDMAAPTCGFNPLGGAGSPDAIADHVVASLRALFSDGEVRGSSDRYLRNATIAALAANAAASLWDVARLLEVGPAGTAERARVAERLVAMPSYAEVATFLADELPAQLADARSTTTAKLDAPANKLARVLNSPAVKRVLLNESLPIDLDRVIEGAEVLVVRGALGEVGAGNVAVLMQLLVGMLDAALGRVQDRRAAEDRPAVALKVDEAPLVINETFAQTLALKRSAGLEVVACWQTDAQWPIELREQLDALFAHRVLFATASSTDARAASGLMLAEYSDQLRPTDEQTVRLATPDVRLHLPRHTAIVSWTTPGGRERPFIATTLPMALDPERIARHAERQRARGARELSAPPPPPTDYSSLQSPPSAAQSPAVITQSPQKVVDSIPDSVAELRDVDGASRVRWLATPAPARTGVLDAADRELLEWLAGARCALSTQVHRRMRPGRALTSTQRQLKRLADRGLVARFQLYRADGGGVPLCCAATSAALELLGIAGRSAPVLGDAALARLRGDLHVVGWLLAFEALAGAAVVELMGPGRAAIAPTAPTGATGAVAPSDVRVEAGLRPRDFLLSGPDGVRRPVERFAPVRPDAVVEVVLDRAASPHCDLLVVRERFETGGAWLEHYDHLVSGWWRAVPRYARAGAPPLVVVLCRDEARAVQCALDADALLCATLAKIGADPLDWERPGRGRICFADEAEIHRGSLAAWQVPASPPVLRDGAPAELRRVELGPLAPAAARSGRLAQPPWR